MPFDLIDALETVADAATSVPDPRNRRERIGCMLGLAVLIFVAVILFLVSFI